MGFLQQHPVPDAGRIALPIDKAWLLLIIGLAALVRFYGLTRPAIWYDEAFSILLGAYSPGLIWLHTAHDAHPPLYYVLLHYWMSAFGNGVFAVRALSVLAGVVTVVQGVWLVSVIANRRAAIIAGLLLAMLPIAVRYSQEVRMYALVGVWLMGATLALIYWVKNPRRIGYLVIYTLLMTAGFYTHYFAGLCALSHWLYLALLRLQSSRERHLITRPAWWLANGAVVVCYVPWIPEIIRQVSMSNILGQMPPFTRFSLPSAIWQFLTLDDGLDLPRVIYIIPSLVMLWVAGWVMLRDRGQYKFDTLVTVYTLAPLLAVGLISFKLSFFYTRYFVFAAIGLPLVLAIALDRLAQRHAKLALLCLALLMGMEGTGLWNVYLQRHTLNYSGHQLNNQIDRAVGEINQDFVTGDRIVVNDLPDYISVVYYNKTGTQPLLRMPASVTKVPGRGNVYGAETLFQSNADNIYLDSLESLPADTRRVWLLSNSNAREFIPAPPNDWQVLRALTMGDTNLRLYSLCASVDVAGQDALSRGCRAR